MDLHDFWPQHSRYILKKKSKKQWRCKYRECLVPLGRSKRRMFILKNSPKHHRIPENTSRNGTAIDRTPVVTSSLQQSTSAPSFTQVIGTSDMAGIGYIDIGAWQDGEENIFCIQMRRGEPWRDIADKPGMRRWTAVMWGHHWERGLELLAEHRGVAAGNVFAERRGDGEAILFHGAHVHASSVELWCENINQRGRADCFY